MVIPYKLSYKQILGAFDTLKVIRQRKEKMSAQVAFFINKNAMELESALEGYYKAYQGLLDKYGTKDDKGQFVIKEDGNITINKEKKDKFLTEYNNLLEQVVNLNIQLIDINSCNTLNIDLDEMLCLQFMFK